VHYNLACIYSLRDDRNPSIKSLRRAFTLDISLINHAKTENDFVNIRESPEFQQLISSLAGV